MLRLSGAAESPRSRMVESPCSLERKSCIRSFMSFACFAWELFRQVCHDGIYSSRILQVPGLLGAIFESEICGCAQWTRRNHQGGAGVTNHLSPKARSTAVQSLNPTRCKRAVKLNIAEPSSSSIDPSICKWPVL